MLNSQLNEHLVHERIQERQLEAEQKRMLALLRKPRSGLLGKLIGWLPGSALRGPRRKQAAA